VDPSISAQLPTDAPDEAKTQIRNYLRVSGTPMLFVEGFLLPELREHVPGGDWPKALKAAIDVINEWSNFSVYNDDSRPDNIKI